MVNGEDNGAMRFFLHMFTGSDVIADREGAEFDDLKAAEAEARQSARDLIAEHLRFGRPIPRHWQAQIASADGTVLRSIAFATLLGGDVEVAETAAPPGRHGFSLLYARVRATADRSRQINEEIHTTVGAIKNQLRSLPAHKTET